MKKLYLLFSCMLCTGLLLAQPTLQYPNNVPQIGDVVQIQFVSTNGLTPAPGGAGVSWDYSNLESTYAGEIHAIDPSEAPAGNEFPQANVVLSMGDTIFTYAITNTDGYFYAGSQSTTGTFPSLLVYSDSRTFLKFPFTYNDTHLDLYRGVVTTSAASVHVTAGSEMWADAYGTLTLPGGMTYNDVLRIITVDAEIDSVFVMGSFLKAYTLTRTQYTWYQANSKSPLMSIEIMDNTYYGVVDTVAYYTMSGSGIPGGQADPVSQLQVYPNPADDYVIIEYETSINTATSIAIVNQLGQLMLDVSVNKTASGSINEKIDISTLPAGLYFVNVTCNCGKQLTEKFVIR